MFQASIRREISPCRQCISLSAARSLFSLISSSPTPYPPSCYSSVGAHPFGSSPTPTYPKQNVCHHYIWYDARHNTITWIIRWLMLAPEGSLFSPLLVLKWFTATTPKPSTVHQTYHEWLTDCKGIPLFLPLLRTFGGPLPPILFILKGLLGTLPFNYTFSNSHFIIVLSFRLLSWLFINIFLYLIKGRKVRKMILLSSPKLNLSS